MFKLTITQNCLDLRNLEVKASWTWKVVGFNSLGDKDGARKFCDEPDDGLTGNPAYWNQNALRFYAFDTKRISEFKCVTDR